MGLDLRDNLKPLSLPIQMEPRGLDLGRPLGEEGMLHTPLAVTPEVAEEAREQI